MRKIRKGDEVVVLAGRDKGKRGSVLRVLDDERALVNDVNVVKRHVKPNPNKGETGGIIEKEAPIQLSNLAVYNPNTKICIGRRWCRNSTKSSSTPTS